MLICSVMFYNVGRMKQFRDIIKAWPSRPAMAADIGAGSSRVSGWYNTNSIPGPWWLPVVNAAKRKADAALSDEERVRFQAITLDLLAELGAAKTDRETDDEQEDEAA